MGDMVSQRAITLFSPVVRMFREMWEQSMEGMMGLIMKSSPSGYTYIAERTSRDAIKKKVYEKQH
jgi:hypothetical protein